MGIVYSYINKINGKRYIGQTINPEQRKRCHISDSKKTDNKFYRAVRKYGWENFSYEILAHCSSREEMNVLEEYYIKEFDSINNGYNIRSGGKHPDMSEETKQKIREALYFTRGELTEEEVIELRLAYLNFESPSQIYYNKYVHRLHFNSFLNIWTGQRYRQVMPEVFAQRKTHKKYSVSTIKEIRAIREEQGLSYNKLAKMFGIPKSTIVDIVKYRTWRHV